MAEAQNDAAHDRPPPSALSKNALKKLQRAQRYEDKKRAKYHDVSRARRARISAVHEHTRRLLNLTALDDEDVEQTFTWDERLGKALVQVFVVDSRYETLQDAYGPDPVRGIDMLGRVIQRPAKYQNKMLPQEYSLLHKLWCVFGGDLRGTCIIDIGAGNGCLAVLAACLFGSTVVILDKYTPRIELRAEESLPSCIRSKVIRIEEDVDTLDVGRLQNLLEDHETARSAVIAKHLCGTGTDVAIEFVSRMPRRPVGVIVATCCGHKIDTSRYSQLYASEPIITRSPSFLKLCTTHVSWRTIPNGLDVERRYAEAFEDIIQAPRIRRLSSLFGSCREDLFIPNAQTPQNRCLTAPNSTDRASDNFFSFLERRLGELGNTIPLDCKPVGLVSSRYDYDGT